MHNLNQLKDKKILITGGSGFIGTNLVNDLLLVKAKIINLSNISPLDKNHNKFYKYCDILDFESLLKIYKSFLPQFCIHLAARTDLNGKNIDEYRANILGTKNLISAINETNCTERVIFASSRLVFQIDILF